jgi:hypothetical protein
MLNTFGLRSVNVGTFNLIYKGESYSQECRNVIVTLLRVHNLCLNILGYIPGVSRFSGCARMLTGVSICLFTLSVGDRNASKGVVVGRWYDEALATGIAQIARGATEAFMPYGRVVNLSLDLIGTINNLFVELDDRYPQLELDADKLTNSPYAFPYPDPNYFLFPFQLLYLV